jgi:hypothetical protein
MGCVRGPNRQLHSFIPEHRGLSTTMTRQWNKRHNATFYCKAIVKRAVTATQQPTEPHILELEIIAYENVEWNDLSLS